MEKRRREYLNELRVNISRAEKAQQRDIETLKNHRGTEKLEIALEKREKQIQAWKQEEENGVSDEKLQEEIHLATEESKTKGDATRKKKTVVPVVPKPREEYRPNLEKDSDYAYRYFLKVTDSIPEYMKQKLAHMPGNKGYIWRGVWFMGDLPSERGQPIVMFERMHDGGQRIHEIYANESVIYEKHGQERKQFISSKPRIPVTVSEGRF